MDADRVTVSAAAELLGVGLAPEEVTRIVEAFVATDKPKKALLGARHINTEATKIVRTPPRSSASLWASPHRVLAFRISVLNRVACKLNGIDPQSYLSDIVSRIANGHPNSRLDELLPWAYADTLALKAWPKTPLTPHSPEAPNTLLAHSWRRIRMCVLKGTPVQP